MDIIDIGIIIVIIVIIVWIVFIGRIVYKNLNKGYNPATGEFEIPKRQASELIKRVERMAKLNKDSKPGHFYLLIEDQEEAKLIIEALRKWLASS